MVRKTSNDEWVARARESGLIDAITAAVEQQGNTRWHRGELRFRCPSPDHDDNDPSADWNPDKAVWTCRSRCGGGGAKELAELLDIDVGQYILTDRNEPMLASKVSVTDRRATADPVTLADWAAERGLDHELLATAWKVFEGPWRGRPALSYTTPLGTDRIKFIDGEEPKYRWATKLPEGAGGGCLYGLQQATELLDAAEVPVLYIVNGEPSVWAAYQSGVPAICTCLGEAAGARHLAQELADALNELGLGTTAIKVVYDNDEAGRSGSLKVVKELTAVGLNTTVLDISSHQECQHSGADVDDLHRVVGDDGLADALAGLAELKPDADAPRDPSQPIEFHDLMGETFERTPFIVDQLLPTGPTILVGQPKAGKTTMALGLSLSVASGTSALAAFGVRAGGVLYLSLEDSQELLQMKLRQMAMGGVQVPRGRLLIQAPGQGDQMPWKRGEAATRLDDFLNGHPDIALVVIDLFAGFRDLTGGLGNQVYQQDYESVRSLRELAAAHPHVAFLVLHHTNKMRRGSGNWVDRISGTTAIAGSFDTLWLLERNRDGGVLATLHVSGKVPGTFDGDAGLLVTYDPQTSIYKVEGTAPGPSLTTEEQAVQLGSGTG